MRKKRIYDVSAELESKFGSQGSQEREAAVSQAWGEYNAQILLDARKEAGITQEELGRRIGADKGYISRVERGLTIPTAATLYRLASAMGMKVELRKHAPKEEASCRYRSIYPLADEGDGL